MLERPLSRAEPAAPLRSGSRLAWLGGGLLLAACWAGIACLGNRAWSDPRRAVPAAGLLLAALASYFSRPSFERRMVADTPATRLGVVRATTAGIALLMTAAERLPELARIGSSFRGRSPGFAGVLDLLPVYSALLASPTALALLQWGTALPLLAATLGYRSRLSVPLSGLAFFVLSGIPRAFTYRYHTGVIIIELLAILSLTPCGDGFSVDRLLAGRRGRSAPARAPGTYGWSVLACLAAIACCYACAAASKLLAGPAWFGRESFEFKLLTDSLEPIYLDTPWKLSLWLHHAHAPAALYTSLAAAGVATEAAYVAILFSRRLRTPLALAATGLHLGILLLQNILFLDLLLIQLVVLDRARPVDGLAAPATAATTPLVPRWRLPAAAVAALVATCALVWMLGVEFFPLTGWTMYAHVNRSPVIYHQMVAVLEDGSAIRLPQSAYAIAAFPNSSALLKRAFDPATVAACEPYLASLGRRRLATWAGRRIVRLEVQRWSWDFVAQPDSPTLGRLDDVHTFDLPSGRHARSRAATRGLGVGRGGVGLLEAEPHVSRSTGR